jgi:hypothetical protein
MVAITAAALALSALWTANNGVKVSHRLVSSLLHDVLFLYVPCLVLERVAGSLCGSRMKNMPPP